MQDKRTGAGDAKMQQKIVWTWHRWADLSPDTLYSFLKLRSDIFVVEQNCVFSDMDGVDARCDHLCGIDENGLLLAYLRLVPPGIKAPQASLGRLVVAKPARGTGAGRAAMLEGMRVCAQRYPGRGMFLMAQQYLERFYGSLGFRTSSAPYLDDGIWHVNMVREG